MEFRDITLNDKVWITKKLIEDNRRGCEYSFANNFIWRDIYHVQVADVCGCCIIRFDAEEGLGYAFPIGNGDKRGAIEHLFEEAKAQGRKLAFGSIVKEDRELLELWFPQQFAYSEERDGFDYLYTVDKLTNLAGKKLHGKRNHIARFKDNNDWRYERMTSENKMECLKMNELWCDRQQCKWNRALADEFCAVKEAILNFEELSLVGGVLYSGREIVAFTIGEPLNADTFVVHIEKAFPEIQGAYPMINQQFVEHECQNFTYVNREDDTGAEGLRKAKLSYYPDILLEKYSAESIGE